MAQQPPALTGATCPVQETAQTSSMQDAVDHGLSPLLQLPSELLQKIWKQAAVGQEHRHALYCTCKAARGVISKFITCMCVDMHMRHRSSRAASAALEQGLAAIMKGFPSLATLKSLVIKVILPTPGGTLSRLLPGFMLKASELKEGKRLQTVEKLTLNSCAAVYTCGDTGSIAAACPSLQEITFAGFSARTPVFKPLAQLARLREVTLWDMNLPQDVMVMQSLSSLSQIEVLSIESDTGQVCLHHVLPHLHGLAFLRCLRLQMSWETASKTMQLFSSLQHLKQLTELQCLVPEFLDRSDLDTFVTGPDVGALGQLTQLVSLALPGFTLDTAALQTLLALPKLVKLEAYSLVATPLQQRSNGEDVFSSCLKKWVLTEGSSLKHPLRRLELYSIEWIDGPGYAGHKPENVRAASELIAQIWTPLGLYPSVTLKSGSANAQLNVALVAALQPLSNIHELHLDGWQIDAPEVRAMLDARSLPEFLLANRCNITDLGFAALLSAAGLRWLIVSEVSSPPDPGLIAGLLLGRCFAGLPLDVTWDDAPEDVSSYCMAQLETYATLMCGGGNKKTVTWGGSSAEVLRM